MMHHVTVGTVGGHLLLLKVSQESEREIACVRGRTRRGVTDTSYLKAELFLIKLVSFL